MSQTNPVTVIVIKENITEPRYYDGHEPLIIDLDQVVFGSNRLHSAVEWIDRVMKLPIDTIFRMELVEEIVEALGGDPEDERKVFDVLATSNHFEPLYEVTDLRKWSAWHSIEAERDADGHCMIEFTDAAMVP